ncbi:MAG: AsmA family protein [Candidatus Parabeggiatoa sp.]|nr:AsmA family protein [Candidatus Parabeggiatoa sp.]
MIRLFKFLLKFLGATIALLLIAIILLLSFVDLNDYKPQIADLVKSTTGRTLTIEGDISLTFFPWFGLDLGKVSLGNASGFEQPTFAQIDQTRVLVKLFSLLKEQVEIDKVLVEGIEVNLTRKADGTTNWDDLLALMGEEKQAKSAPPFEAFKIDGLELRQAKIVWADQQSGSRYVLSDVNINVSAIDINLATSAIKEPITFELGTALDISGPTTLTGQIDFNTQIAFNPENQQYRIEPLQLTLTVEGEQVPTGQQTLSLQTELIKVDLKEQTMTLAGLVAKVMEARLNLDAKVQNFQTHPILSGQLQLHDLKPQQLIKQLNLQVVLPSDKILKTVSLETQFQGSFTGINIMNLHLMVDDNHLKIPQLNIDLDKQTLNLESLSLQAIGLNLNGQANVTQLFKQPSVKGKIALVPFNPRQVLKRLENLELLSTVPTLPDKSILPLQTVAFETQFQVHEATQVSVTNLQLRVDDHYFKTPQIDIDLNQQTLNANQLLLQAFGINLNSQVNIKNLLSPQPTVRGQITIAPFNPRLLVKRLEQAQLIPPQSLPEEKLLPLKTASFNTQFEVRQATKMRVKNLLLRLDDNQFKLPRLDVDLDRETLDIPTFSLQALGITLKGQVNAQKILSKMRAQVELNLMPFNPQNVLKRLGQPRLDLPPPLTLTHAAFQTHFSLTPKQVKVSNLRVMIDKTELQSTQIKLNLARDTLTLGNLKFKVFGQTYLNGNLSAKQLSTDPQLQGSLKINTFDPRKLLKRLGQPLPETTDPTVLKRFALETQLKGSLSQVQLEPIKIRLDDTWLKGYLKVHHFEQPAIAFQLNVNDIDIDRYLPVEKSEKAPPPSNEPASLPLKMLHSLDINGALKVEQLKAMGISLNNIEFDVTAQKGEFKVTPKDN